MSRHRRRGCACAGTRHCDLSVRRLGYSVERLRNQPDGNAPVPVIRWVQDKVSEADIASPIAIDSPISRGRRQGGPAHRETQELRAPALAGRQAPSRERRLPGPREVGGGRLRSRPGPAEQGRKPTRSLSGRGILGPRHARDLRNRTRTPALDHARRRPPHGAAHPRHSHVEDGLARLPQSLLRGSGRAPRRTKDRLKLSVTNLRKVRPAT